MTKLKALTSGFMAQIEGDLGLLDLASQAAWSKPACLRSKLLGYEAPCKEKTLHGVRPLTEKWIITLSTDYSDSEEVVSLEDLQAQLYFAISLFPNVHYTDKLVITFKGRTRDPLENHNIFELCRWLHANRNILERMTSLRIHEIHPILTTTFSSKPHLRESRFFEWVLLKNNLYKGQAGFRLKLEEGEGPECLSETELSLVNRLPSPVGRKYSLLLERGHTAFPLPVLRERFSPEHWVIRLSSDIPLKASDEVYAQLLKAEMQYLQAGYDVLLYVPPWAEH